MHYWRYALAVLSLISIGTQAADKPAPDFTLKSNSGENIRLAEQRGSVVMLNFWATWCGPCRQEMPLLDKMYQHYRAAGFVLYGINVEADSSKAKKYINKLGISFPVLFDPKGRASSAYKVDAMPFTVIIDKDGKIRYMHRGYHSGDEDEYRTKVRELIAE